LHSISIQTVSQKRNQQHHQDLLE